MEKYMYIYKTESKIAEKSMKYFEAKLYRHTQELCKKIDKVKKLNPPNTIILS